jgi:hypothetical protein
VRGSDPEDDRRRTFAWISSGLGAVVAGSLELALSRVEQLAGIVLFCTSTRKQGEGARMSAGSSTHASLWIKMDNYKTQRCFLWGGVGMHPRIEFPFLWCLKNRIISILEEFYRTNHQILCKKIDKIC